MKIKIILLFILIFFKAKSQQIDIFGYNNGDTVIICNDITLLSNISLINNNTLNYTISNIPFNPYSYLGSIANGVFSSQPLIDDEVSGIIPIGFNFCFFGNQYNQCYIGSNGWISFSPGQPTTFTALPIPQFSPIVPRNCIMGPWYDLNPGISTASCGGNTARNYIRYRTEGVAPYRRFIVSWVSIPLYGCVTTCGTQQIVLYETTNIIENYIARKPLCAGWAGGTSTQGLHNLLGTFAVTVPGRNASAWTSINEGVRYIPFSSITPNVAWRVNGVLQIIGQSFNFDSYPSGCYTVSASVIFDCTTIQSSEFIIICVDECCNNLNPVIFEN
jgi:hypothetical protein